MADDKKNATLAQKPDNTKAADTADNKDAKELSEDELGAVAGGAPKPNPFTYIK